MKNYGFALLILTLTMAWSCKDGTSTRHDSDQGSLPAAGKPKASDIDAIEASLSGNACVKSIHRWQRFYAFDGNKHKGLDLSRIRFEYRSAGKFGFVDSRNVSATEDWVNLDDRQYDMVLGTYDVPNSRLNVEYCGPNVPNGP
jgi:hypothetical protein